MEEVCEQRAGRTPSDNGYLRAFWDLAHAPPTTLGSVLYASRTNGRSAYRKSGTVRRTGGGDHDPGGGGR
jgi:hypothetical protein